MRWQLFVLAGALVLGACNTTADSTGSVTTQASYSAGWTKPIGNGVPDQIRCWRYAEFAEGMPVNFRDPRTGTLFLACYNVDGSPLQPHPTGKEIRLARLEGGNIVVEGLECPAYRNVPCRRRT